MNAYFAGAYSSVGRAPVLHTGGHRFESCCAHVLQNKAFAGVVQLVRAPACHVGSCGFKPRLPRFVFQNALSILIFLLTSCSQSGYEDYRSRGQAIVKSLVKELKSIRTRDDLLIGSKKLFPLFIKLADVVEEAQEMRKNHPELEIPEFSAQESLQSDELKAEFQRVILIDGGAEVLQECQKAALDRLQGRLF